ncbi:MAG: hypothetical protein ACTIK4_12300, partial [Mesonia sp.]
GTSALLKYNLDTKTEGEGVSICPGPNLAYFSAIMGLKEITSHIYGESKVNVRTDRPNLFVKELTIYLDYLNDKLAEAEGSIDAKQKKYLSLFAKNLGEGINYYKDLFSSYSLGNSNVLPELEKNNQVLQTIIFEIENAGELVH